MPVTIGIFVSPGRVLAQKFEEALDRYNRSYEYDGLGDKYARFLLEEILPLVENEKTANGCTPPTTLIMPELRASYVIRKGECT